MKSEASPFGVLFREFFGQFFASESVTSDIRLRQVIIAVVAFLLTPGLLLSTQMFPAYEYARFRAPELVLPMTRMLATLFLTFSMVAVGLIGALVWDTLSLDRRDAMVLGPLPVSRATIVRAKLAALAALLVGASLCINILTALPFAVVASLTPLDAVRHAIAHMVATSYAALFVFSALVILRALLGLLTSGHSTAVFGSLLQFAFVSVLLCFFILAPLAADFSPRGRGAGMTIRLASLPAWLPSHYFLAMYEQVRGTADAEMVARGQRTAMATLTLAACAVLLTIGACRRQFQLALAPAASAGALGGARITRALARTLSGSNRVAHATSDFLLTTIVRNRAQQTPIAINAAIGLGLFIVKLVPRQEHVATVWTPVTLFAIPLMLTYWTCIGLRASFFVPSELPASWTFRANAPTATNAYALGTRAAIVALVGPPAGLVALVLAGLSHGWLTAALHATFVLLLVVALADFVVLTIGHVPFTAAYRPGHAKLKVRWPLYLLGAYVFGDGLASRELRYVDQSGAFAAVIVAVATVVSVFEWAVRRRGRGWRMEMSDEMDDASSITVLDLGHALRMQDRPAS